ncbi:metallophosphoesterase family protein [Paenibacillus sp. MBLB4367]|uniref:metallophosphoesterase family protein n=1 Tax=Paenibacillus sp. MBLB4367 TaxID=3384767 RepID=UPI0039081088
MSASLPNREQEVNGRLPDYLQASVQTAITKANSLRSDRTLQFIFITDPHHQVGGNQLHAAKAVRELAAGTSAAFIVCGGDMSINGPKDESLQAQKEILQALTLPGYPLFPVKGNHDDNSIRDFYHHKNGTDNVIFPDEMYGELFKGLEGTVRFDADNAAGLYYYYDVPERRTRVIVLDAIDIPYRRSEEGGLVYNGQWKYAFSNRQLNWMAHHALDFTDKSDRTEWKIILFSHVALLQDDVYGTDNSIENDRVMWELLRAYQQGCAYTSEPVEGDFAQSVTADFTEQGPGTLVASLFGHVHFDQAVAKDGILMISSLNACTHRDFDNAPARTEGTITETAFDLVTVDYGQGKLYFTRVGAGEDRVVDMLQG